MHEFCRSHASQKQVLQDAGGVFRESVKHVRRIEEEHPQPMTRLEATSGLSVGLQVLPE